MSPDALFEVLLTCATGSPRIAGVSLVSDRAGDTYVYRDADIDVVGVLRVLSSGVFVIAVRQDARRNGIATALLDAASQGSLKPDFKKTAFGTDGQAFIVAYHREKELQ
jgi:hypothetical protein